MTKHTQILMKFIVALCIAGVLLGLTFWLKPDQAQLAEIQTDQGMALQPPAFLKSAYAQESTGVDFSFILEEAGVTAYANLNRELDLESMQVHFKTIRQQTDQFISGIVIAPGYEKLPEFGENAEIQVFLHRDGWVVAYLTQWQLASAMFDWVNYDEKRLANSTLIENVVRLFVFDTGVSDFNVLYYDFRHSDATNLLLVADHADAQRTTESFEINIPRQLTIYESSWSSAQIGISMGGYQNKTAYPGSCVLNGEELASHNPGGKWGLWSGELTKIKFPPDTDHKLSVTGSGQRSYCGLAIVYQEATQ